MQRASLIHVTILVVLLLSGFANVTIAQQGEPAGWLNCPGVLPALQAQYKDFSDATYAADMKKIFEMDRATFDQTVTRNSAGVGGYGFSASGEQTKEHLNALRERWQDSKDERVRSRILNESTRIVGDDKVLEAWRDCFKHEADLRKQAMRGQRSYIDGEVKEAGDLVIVTLRFVRGQEDNPPNSATIDKITPLRLSPAGNMSSGGNAPPELVEGMEITNSGVVACFVRNDPTKAAFISVSAGPKVGPFAHEFEFAPPPAVPAPKNGNVKCQEDMLMAFKAGKNAVASKGHFKNQIKVAWLQRLHPTNQTPATAYGVARLKPDGSPDAWFHIVRKPEDGQNFAKPGVKIDKWFDAGQALFTIDDPGAPLGDPAHPVTYLIMAIWDWGKQNELQDKCGECNGW